MWKIEHCGSDKKCGFFINGQFCMCLVFFIQPLHSIYIHSFKEFFHSIASYSSTILSQLILLHALSTLCWHDWAVIMPFRCLSSELFIEVVERIAFDILCHPQTQLNILKMPLHWDKVGVILYLQSLKAVCLLLIDLTLAQHGLLEHAFWTSLVFDWICKIIIWKLVTSTLI